MPFYFNGMVAFLRRRGFSFVKITRETLNQFCHFLDAPYSWYKCDLCSEVSTNSLEKIRKHYERDHQQIFKPYHCQFCGKGFILNEDLLWHQNDQHDISKEKYKCPSCPNIYISPRLFTVHQVSK